MWWWYVCWLRWLMSWIESWKKTYSWISILTSVDKGWNNWIKIKNWLAAIIITKNTIGIIKLISIMTIRIRNKWWTKKIYTEIFFIFISIVYLKLLYIYKNSETVEYKKVINEKRIIILSVWSWILIIFFYKDKYCAVVCTFYTKDWEKYFIKKILSKNSSKIFIQFTINI
jgi:hypothetical protein